MEKITLAIPTFRKPKSLTRLLKSAVRCTNPNLTEIIVLFDRGDPFLPCPEVFKGVKMIESSKFKQGSVSACKEACSYASNAIVGCVADDCEFETPDSDVLIIEAFQTRKRDTCCFGLNDERKGFSHPFLMKSTWERPEVFPICYKCYFGDLELYELALYHNEWNMISNVELRHHHEDLTRFVTYKVEELEERQPHETQRIKADRQVYLKRKNWWRKNGKPRFVSDSIGVS